MTLRYEVEFAATLGLLAVMGAFGVERALASRPGIQTSYGRWRRGFSCISPGGRTTSGTQNPDNWRRCYSRVVSLFQ
jgi:hypothetical protein